jgi:LysM repeat protein
MSSVTVRPGDTLSGIASQYGVDLGALEAANPQIADFNVINIGDAINVPDGFDPPAPPSNDPAPGGGLSTYMVQPGDTLGGIASSLGVSLDALEAANPQITNPDLISVGDQINVPGAGSAPVPDPTPAPAPAPAPSSSSSASDVAARYLGRRSDELEQSGQLDMQTWVPANVDCANFVSGCLEQAGDIDPSLRSASVTQLAANLRGAGWHDVDMSQARPGDVVCMDGGEGAYQHVEIFAGWQSNGQPYFIGSNNVNADGTQSITYDYGGWQSGFHVIQKP